MKHILLVASLLVAATVHSAEISSVDASRAARAWVRNGETLGQTLGATVSRTDTLLDDASGASMHVVSFEGGGFVVMPTDDRIDPVVCFSRSSEPLRPSDDNPLWVLLKGDLAARAAAAGVGMPAPPEANGAESASAVSTAAQRKWATLLDAAAKEESGIPVPPASDAVGMIGDARVDSFVQTRWGQSEHNELSSGKDCYNYYTPNHYACGCVATVTSQIMKYFTWPTTSVTAKSFNCQVDGGTATSYKMKGGTYSWSNMPLVPANGVTETQCQAIGKLTYDVGVSVGMNWGEHGSGASMFAARLRLKDTFSYASCEGVSINSGTFAYSIDRVKQIVIPCCDARSPIAMSISGSSGGHAVLVDGYGYSGADFYMHVNCGWSGTEDAWYNPPNLSMATFSFDTINGFLFNIHPSKTGTTVSGRVLDASGAPIAGASVSLKSGATVKDTTTTDARGIYAFVVETTGSYTISASFGGSSAGTSVSVVANQSKNLSSSGGYYDIGIPQYIPVIGNTYGNDITISGIAGVAQPVISPDPGLFYPSLTVSISCPTAGATIRYTTDGTDPTESSPAYSAPFTISDDTVVRARAYKSGMNPSIIAAATYTYDSAQGAPKGDYYDNPLEISGASGSRTVDDTTNFSLEPGEPKHTSKDGSSYYQYRTVWYRWTAPGSGTMTFTVNYENPSYYLNAAVAVYSDSPTMPSSIATRVAMSFDYDSSSHTTSVSLPVTQGTTYRIVGVPLSDKDNATLVLSWSGNLSVSEICADPVFSPASGTTFTTSQQVTISCATSGATIRYTTNGSDPTSSSSKYTAPFTVSATTTVKAKAFKSGATDSGVVSATYTKLSPVATPSISPSSGKFFPSQQVTISCSTSGATIRYTKDGSDPTSSSPKYTAPFTVSATTTVKARAFKSGMADSSVASATFTYGATTSTAVPVPHSWLVEKGLAASNASASTFESAAKADTDGDGFPAWKEYVANTEPKSKSDHLHITAISFDSSGAPVLTVHPAKARDGYPQVIQGKATLDGTWGTPTASSRFFRVTIPLE